MRGKPGGRLPAPALQRSIPARAGETRRATSCSRSTTVHPRACGGNQAGDFLLPLYNGPSPRVRGKRGNFDRYETLYGSIPARAGETPRRARRRTPTWVHPRACGGNVRRNASGSRLGGPSPRVRGKHSCPGGSGSLRRSIPARAGETVSFFSPHPSHRVHPRACGGNLNNIGVGEQYLGPSPRVRGKLHGLEGSLEGCGSIPARAGETRSGLFRSSPHRVHPRACGGNVRFKAAVGAQGGPSPRVRGKHRPPRREQAVSGSIPARAGETPRGAPPRPGPAVHPRACGGNVLDTFVASPPKGPSPRVRGKRRDPAGDGQSQRSIPARAGETLIVTENSQLLRRPPKRPARP